MVTYASNKKISVSLGVGSQYRKLSLSEEAKKRNCNQHDITQETNERRFTEVGVEKRKLPGSRVSQHHFCGWTGGGPEC